MSVLAIVDCNNFYVSCERVFNPALRDRPVVVLSNNDGIVVARSPEAKLLGIRMGQPYFECRDRIKRAGGQVFSSNYALYGDMSRRVLEVLQRFSPAMEIYSIDEAFLELSEPHELLESRGAEICETVYRWTGIPVSVGIAPTKTLAKVAVHEAKREGGGVRILVDEWDEVLAGLDVQAVWGIGPRSGQMLAGRGVYTAGQLAAMPDEWVRARLRLPGLRTVRELRGERCITLDDAPTSSRSIVCSRSFGHRVRDLLELREAVAAFASRATEKARNEDLAVGCAHVFLGVGAPLQGRIHTATCTFPSPQAYTPLIAERLCRLTEDLFIDGAPYYKAGVMLDALVPRGAVQMSLFEEETDHAAQDRLMAAMDAVNRRYGRGSMGLASAGLSHPWQMHQSHRSRRFTTCWEDLPRVHAR